MLEVRKDLRKKVLGLGISTEEFLKGLKRLKGLRFPTMPEEKDLNTEHFSKK